MFKKVSELRENKFNVKVYGKEKLSNDFIENIRKNGVLVPIAIKKDGTVVSGHRRLQAAKEVKLKTVPAYIVKFKTETDEKEALIDFNRQREKTFSQRMNESVQLEIIERERAEQRMKAGKRLDPLRLVEEGSKGNTSDKVAEKIGIGKKDTFYKAKKIWEAKQGNNVVAKMVDKIDTGEMSIGGVFEEIKRLEQKEKQKAKFKALKPAFGKFPILQCKAPSKGSKIAPNSIIQADCFRVLPFIEDKSIDMILADLPLSDGDSILPLDKLWKEYCRIIKDNGAIVLFGTGLFAGKLMVSKAEMFQYDLVWSKGNRATGFQDANKKPVQSHEWVLVFFKNQPTYNPQMSEVQNGEERNGKDKFPKSILNFEKPHPPIHPTQKPVELCEWLIKTYTNAGELVLDNTAGSGTTGLASINTKRNFILIEKERDFCDMAYERMMLGTLTEKNDVQETDWRKKSFSNLNSILKIGTLFSGIGGAEQALIKLKLKHKIAFACDNDKEVKKSYFANYKIEESDWYSDVRQMYAAKYKGKVDIIVGGSPCQAFSIAGKQAGLKDVRGTLFYHYARIISEVQPKCFIYENVEGLLTHDGGNTWKVIQNVFNEIGYKTHFQILNSKDYGIPQDRNRIFVVGIKKHSIDFKFPQPIELTKTVPDCLQEGNVSESFYYREGGYKFKEISKTVTNPNTCYQWRRAYVRENKSGLCPTLTANMGTGGHNVPLILTKAGIRKLTPHECLNLMGFQDSFKIVVSDAQMYKQAGNSIVADNLIAIFRQMDVTQFAETNNINENSDWRTMEFSRPKAEIRIGTLFSGIGAAEQAMKRLNIRHSIAFASDIDPDVKKSYFANYKIGANDWHDDVTKFSAKKYKGQVDIIIGGSPCQSFSLAGKRKGFADTRGTLFYDYARIISETKPKVFIYENVKGLLSHDGGNTWKVIQNVFRELGYNIFFKVLNSVDYGIPQQRERIFVVGFRDPNVSFTFPQPIELEHRMQDFLEDTADSKYLLTEKVAEYVQRPINLKKKYTQVNGDVALTQRARQQANWNGDFVTNNNAVDDKYYLSDKMKAYVMAEGTKAFKGNPETDMAVAHPILASSHKMHRSSVDNFITNEKGIRRLTPRECLNLMGFQDNFKIVVSDTQAYRQAGNSIVVNVLIAILKQMDVSQFGK